MRTGPGRAWELSTSPEPLFPVQKIVASFATYGPRTPFAEVEVVSQGVGAKQSPPA